MFKLWSAHVMRNSFFVILFGLSLSNACWSIADVLPSLPEPVTNNAVASITLNDQLYLFSFMGLGEGKTYKDVHNKAWQLVINRNKVGEWRSIATVPSSQTLQGRLASVAVGVKDRVYLFGGYTVASDHSEISVEDVYQYSPNSGEYKQLKSMPIPVDDAVALVYQDRYIYLISGWHNDGNVNLTQIYDTQNDQWFQGSPYLGQPVFGHAGAIVNNRMLVCDGVKVVAQPLARRTFQAEPACYLGLISPSDNTKIDWQQVSHPTGQGRYRMAATGDMPNNLALFYGGSINPYNYDGVGYDGEPSEPSNQLWVFNFDTFTWVVKPLNSATMDHRGMIKLADQWITIGGMGTQQKVLNTITSIKSDALTSQSK